MKITHADDTTVYQIHQSDLNLYMRCPELARRVWAGDVEDIKTESAARGTAVHAGAAAYLLGLDRYQAWEEAALTLERLADEGLRWVKVKRYDTLLTHMTACFNAFVDDVYPKLGNPVAIEHKFALPFADDDGPKPTDGRRSIVLAGAIDYVDETGVVDFKTGDLGKYMSSWGGEGWKLRRYGVQPTVYTAAAAALKLVEADETGCVPFTYAAMSTTGHTAWLPCSRSQADWDWLTRLCWNVVAMIEANLPEWPLNDQSALCAADWCPAWASCKGSHQPSQGSHVLVTTHAT